MTRRGFLLFACIVEIVFGLGFLLVPHFTLWMMEVSLGIGGSVMTRALGAAVLGLAWAYWKARDMPQGPGLLTILDAGTIYSALSGIAFLIAVLNRDIPAPGGLAAFGLHVVLTAGLLLFGRFGKS